MNKMAVMSIKQFKDSYESGRLTGLKCDECGHKHITYIVVCPNCGSKKLTLTDISTTGTVRVFTLQSVPSEKFVNEAPYAYAIIKLDDGTDIAGWLPYVKDASNLKIGDRVKYTKSYKYGLVFVKEGEEPKEEVPTDMVYY
jgi:uncharacterized OB-fold protein